MGPRKGHVPVGHALLLFRIFPPPLHLSHRHPVDLVHTYAVPASQRGLTTHEVLYKRLLNHNSFPWLFFGTTTCLPGSFSQLLVLSIVLLRRVWALKFNKLKSQVSHERTRALQVNRPYFKPQYPSTNHEGSLLMTLLITQPQSPRWPSSVMIITLDIKHPTQDLTYNIHSKVKLDLFYSFH